MNKKFLLYIVACVFLIILSGCMKPQNDPIKEKLMIGNREILSISETKEKQVIGVISDGSTYEELITPGYSISDGKGFIDNGKFIYRPDREIGQNKFTLVKNNQPDKKYEFYVNVNESLNRKDVNAIYTLKFVKDILPLFSLTTKGEISRQAKNLPAEIMMKTIKRSVNAYISRSFNPPAEFSHTPSSYFAYYKSKYGISESSEAVYPETGALLDKEENPTMKARIFVSKSDKYAGFYIVRTLTEYFSSKENPSFLKSVEEKYFTRKDSWYISNPEQKDSDPPEENIIKGYIEMKTESFGGDHEIRYPMYVGGSGIKGTKIYDYENKQLPEFKGVEFEYKEPEMVSPKGENDYSIRNRVLYYCGLYNVSTGIECYTTNNKDVSYTVSCITDYSSGNNSILYAKTTGTAYRAVMTYKYEIAGEKKLFYIETIKEKDKNPVYNISGSGTDNTKITMTSTDTGKLMIEKKTESMEYSFKLDNEKGILLTGIKSGSSKGTEDSFRINENVYMSDFRIETVKDESNADAFYKKGTVEYTCSDGTVYRFEGIENKEGGLTGKIKYSGEEGTFKSTMYNMIFSVRGLVFTDSKNTITDFIK